MSEESRLETIPEIAKRHGLSRQRVHLIAQTDSAFPNPVVEPGSTRVRYSSAAVDTYFGSRVLRPGRRTDLQAEPPQSTPPGAGRWQA
jgi:predicted DNA-binding transcriptional regulator AlpA